MEGFSLLAFELWTFLKRFSLGGLFGSFSFAGGLFLSLFFQNEEASPEKRIRGMEQSIKTTNFIKTNLIGL